MTISRRQFVWFAKVFFAVAIIAAVGRYFAILLADEGFSTSELTIRWQYLVPAGLLYLVTHTLWGTFWWMLLRSQKVTIAWPAAVRAYFVSQFGKYLPGKAWVLLMRVGLLRDVPTAKPTIIMLTGVYETLTSMAAGAMLAAILVPAVGIGGDETARRVPVLIGLAMLPLGIVTLNLLVQRIARRTRGPEGRAIPSPPIGLMLYGLLQASVGWCCLAISLGCVILAVVPGSPADTLEWFPHDLAAVAASYVVGFVAIILPGGIGARELILQEILTPRLEQLGNPTPKGTAVFLALVLRLTWTLFELVLATGWYFFPPKPSPPRDESLSPMDPLP